LSFSHAEALTNSTREERMMNGINVNVNPEQVNQVVADAIIKSAIGEHLDKAIKAEVDKLSRSYDNPVQKVVQAEIRDAITNIVHEQYAEKIKMLVAEKVTEQFTEELFEKLWNAFTSRY